MQNTSQLYQDILSDRNHWFEYKLEVEGAGTFGEDVVRSIQTKSEMFQDDPEIGKAVSAEIDVEMLTPSAELPQMAEMRPFVRVCAEGRQSEWIPQGVFYIDTRSRSKNQSAFSVLTIHGFDAMMKAEQPFQSNTITGDSTDTDMVDEIASILGVEVDPRTYDIMTSGYTVPLPTGYSCREVLGFIGSMYVGSFVMTEEGKLRLVSILELPPETNYLITEEAENITFGYDHPETTDTYNGSIVSFENGGNTEIQDVSVAVEPVQDLHGYGNPWPAGGGKNKLPVTLTTRTVNGVTFTVNDDGTISLSGTATDNIIQTINTTTKLVSGESYKLAGCPTGGGTAYYMRSTRGCVFGNTSTDFGAAATATDEALYLFIYIASGTNTNGLVFKPMICLSTETDSTFAPYSNICPITGWTGAKVTRTGKNLCGEPFKHGLYSASNGEFYSHEGASSKCVAVGIIPIKGGQAYTISWENDPTNIAITATACFYRGSEFVGVQQLNASSQIISPENVDGVGINLLAATAITSISQISISKPQLELGSTVTAYEPYQDQVYTIDLNGTRYGGTLDVTTGKLTVDRVMVDLDGSHLWRSWGVNYRTQGITGFYLMRRDIASYDFATLGLATLANLLPIKHSIWGGSDVGYYSNLKSASANDCYEMASFYNSSLGIVDTDTNAQAIEKLKLFLNTTPINAVYELITPIVYDLTPTEVSTLLGTNNVWADAGDITVNTKTAGGEATRILV